MIRILNKGKEIILLYRFLRFRKGFGVHSPFAFNLIINVIDERYGYYCYDTIELVRRQLCQNQLPFGDGRQSVGRAAVKLAIRPAHGRLLFRLANYFKPKRLLQIGCGMGISTLYMTAYSSHLRCIVLEEDPAKAEWAQWSYKKAGGRNLKLEAGKYETHLCKALQQLGKVDFVFFNAGLPNVYDLFLSCMEYITSDTVIVLEGLRDSQAMRNCWKQIKQHPDVVLTFDLYHIGLVFFNKKLHRKDYIVYF